MESLELVARSLANPVYAFRRSIDVRPFGAAILVLILSSLSTSVGSMLVNNSPPSSVGPALGLGVPLSVVVTAGFLFCFAAVVHVVVDIRGGAGSAYALFLCFCLAMAPNMISTPLSVVFDSIGTFEMGFFALGGFARAAWIIALVVLAVREVYRLSTGAAIWILILVVGGGLLIFAFVTTASIVAFTMIAGQALSETSTLSAFPASIL